MMRVGRKDLPEEMALGLERQLLLIMSYQFASESKFSVLLQDLLS